MKQEVDAIVSHANGDGMPARGYLLCGLERTGSSLLAGALAGTGAAGRPMEYFNAALQDQPWMREILGDGTVIDRFNQILIAGTTANGVFGAKVHWPHLRFLGMQIEGEWRETRRTKMYEILRSPGAELMPLEAAKGVLRAHFSDLRPQAAACSVLRSHVSDLRFLWIRRKNQVARAVSAYRARTTGVWSRTARDSGVASAKQAAEFDLAEIHNLYCVAAFQEESWGQFFKEQGVTPFCVEYEGLAENHETWVRQVLDFLEIDYRGMEIPKPTSIKQADTLSQKWEQLYRTAVPEAG